MDWLVLRWLDYLRRIAALYASGKLTVQPVLADIRSAVLAAVPGGAEKIAYGMPTVTLDGVAVRLMANIEKVDEVALVKEYSAEGVGLFRTELCFLDRDSEPTVEEQATIYAEVLDA